jgi:hypothetical protein
MWLEIGNRYSGSWALDNGGSGGKLGFSPHPLPSSPDLVSA